ncbi:MAG: hypothetical protein PS018_17225 [bacterium]|nr:hypothetical protein [bacterium]
MNALEKTTADAAALPLLIKTDPASAVLKATGRDSLVIKAGTSFCGTRFEIDRDVAMPVDGLKTGADYAVTVVDGIAVAARVDAPPVASSCIGGFHFAPGGNAAARSGGDDVPAINHCSLWDLNFRPACPDPRGMALVQAPGGQFWCDIYLAGADCDRDGTSRFDVTIADGDDCPKAAGKRYRKFDYETAAAVMAAHGKGLLSVEEFFAAAFGVTEKTARSGNPRSTGLDAPRTSRFGIMQATGNMWVWGHDGDPDMPRASFFGGSWLNDGLAGSRCAIVDLWPGYSGVGLGARGRSDHLQRV